MARRFRWPVIVAALLVIPVIVLEEAEVREPWSTVATVANWLIWLTFLAELVAMLSVVPDRRAWLRQHPLEVAVVVLTPPFLPASLQAARVFRLLRLLRLLLTLRRIQGLFTPHGLRAATVVAGFGILISAAAFAAVEREQDLGVWDGVYWAVTTTTTVGYGDLLPQTDAGRAIAIVVMLVGISYLAILTAALAQQFFARVVEEELEAADDEVLRRLRDLDQRLARIEEAVRGPGR
jgi:voltage-gated potassium channel